MSPAPSNDPLGQGAPLPAPLDGDPSSVTAGVEAEVHASDEFISAPNPALDMLVARDAAAVAAVDGKRAKANPLVKTTPGQEWGAAIVLIILFMFICAAAISFFRG